MGVIHKLKPEVSNFILEAKRSSPELACRALAQLAQDNFKIAVSKSSVNKLIKDSGLSMPVGRRRKLRQGSAECLGLGVIFLKAADYCLGGCQEMAKILQEKKKISREEALFLLEPLLFSPSLPSQSQERALGLLVDRRMAPKDGRLSLEELNKDSALAAELMQRINGIAAPVRYFEIELSDGSTYYLDGQLHTVWTTPHIPPGFATTYYKASNALQAMLKGDSVLSLFLAPGYEAPTKLFISFLRSALGEVAITKVTLCGNNAQEYEAIVPQSNKGYTFICGVWPWQFREFGSLKIASEFRRYIFLPLKKEFFIAPAEIEFPRLTQEDSITLRGVALKSSPEEAIRILILGNFAQGQCNIDTVANEYLGQWADPAAILQDYSKKIEDFVAGKATEEHFLLTPPLASPEPGIKGVITRYRELLDRYVRLYFLPEEQAKESMAAIQGRFYSLKAILTKKKEYTIITFIPPHQYEHLDALKYACQRVNQGYIWSAHLKRLFLTV